MVQAMDVSCHSFVRMANLAAPLMTDGGSMFAMSDHGANKVVANYNVMGPVKAALEASCRYLAYELDEPFAFHPGRVQLQARRVHVQRVRAPQEPALEVLDAQRITDQHSARMLDLHPHRSPAALHAQLHGRVIGEQHAVGVAQAGVDDLQCVDDHTRESPAADRGRGAGRARRAGRSTRGRSSLKLVK